MKRTFWLIFLCIVGVLLAGVFYLRHFTAQQLQAQTLQYAREALEQDLFEEAETQAKALLVLNPDSLEAARIAAESASQLQRPSDALAYLEPMLDRQDAEIAAYAGHLYLQIGQASKAETQFRQAIQWDPKLDFARERLLYLLTLQGRRWEGREARFARIQANNFTPDDLLFLGNEKALVISKELDRFLAETPDDPNCLLGKARLQIRDGEHEQAQQMLQQVLKRQPQQIEAWAALGISLSDRSKYREVVSWNSELPVEAEAHPDVWVVRGLWALNHGQNEAASRCFWEACRRDPNHVIAHYQLSVTLTAMGKRAQAVAFEQRARNLEKFVAAIDSLFRELANVRRLREAAELAQAMGRLWEAWGWYRVCHVIDPSQTWAAAAADQLQPLLNADVPQVLPTHQLASQLDLTSSPLPDFKVEQLAQADDPNRSFSGLAMVDISQEVGISHQYFCGEDPKTEGRRMFEFTGGGVAALDYDADGWQDLYFTQGTSWPPTPGQAQYRDRLFRNLGNGRFEDVTEAAGLGDDRFSQGVAAGDFDNDGYCDLYVANVGANRLYHNQGDGTFVEVTQPAGVAGIKWTSSCAIADLNGDGFPDLYEVNYLEGENVYDLICNRGGKNRTCTPGEFDAQQDRVFVSRGDGTFEDQTKNSGILVPDGKGLGLIVADFEGSGQLGVFVANDTTANFYFVNQTQAGQPLRFSEQGLLRGLAYDQYGAPQACMGVGVEDLDGNRQLDLFVTNFYQESNSLYIQQEGGFFIEQARPRGLYEPSYSMLGFGTQFMDIDLDGRSDLIVTNGHIDDFRHDGAPYQMRPQLLVNRNGQFREAPAAQLGGFFATERLGRGLARLDWNRDGRPDFAVSHLDAPVALVENRVASPGNYLILDFVTSASARDAIGVRLEFLQGKQPQTYQLTAGDGYMASNQRSLLIGLGEQQAPLELKVTWPGGTTQSVVVDAVNSHWKLIEGDAAYQLP